MTNSKHTPGPWEFEDLGEDEDNLRINQWERMDASKVAIAIIPVGYSEPFESEQRANAHLLLAAPELLEALRIFVEKYDARQEGDLGFGFVNGDFTRARAAIARAEGRTHD